jgi:DNA-binding XRE family transcriptional regulator
MSPSEKVTALLEGYRLKRRLPLPEKRRELRLKAMIPQSKVALAIGVSRTTFAEFEKGDREIPTDALAVYVEFIEELERVQSENGA